jgi:hypothetical protein
MCRWQSAEFAGAFARNSPVPATAFMKTRLVTIVLQSSDHKRFHLHRLRVMAHGCLYSACCNNSKSR